MTPGPRDPYRGVTGPLSVRVNGAPGGRLVNISPPMGGGSGGSVSPGNSGTTGTSSQTTRTTPLDQSRDQSSHVTDLSHLSHLSHVSPIPHGDLCRMTGQKRSPFQRGTSGIFPCKWTLRSNLSTASKGCLTTLGMLCLTSLLLAILALMFLMALDSRDGQTTRGRISQSVIGGDATVEEVTLALAALTLALDLCCLLICSAQFVFALKLVKDEGGEERLIKYLQQLSLSRVFAVGAFFVSIPIFLTGVILYTFSHFQRTPAILSSVLIGCGILVCGFAMIHNVFVWQKEKAKIITQRNINISSNHRTRMPEMSSSPLPTATLDLSRSVPPHELSTLV
ncbi:UNVERIFIED_CONTAM: hypothetical protein RMT77_015906 [Armadillidium vulgare]